MDASLILEDFISRSRIPLINYRFKSRSSWSSFGWSTMTKFSEGPALSIKTFQMVQHEVIYFSFAVRKKVSELSKNCTIHCKNCKISGLNFWTPIKTSILDVSNWKCWTLLGLEIEERDHGSSGLPSGYAPAHVHVIS